LIDDYFNSFSLVHYESFLQDTNVKFDSTRERKAEFTFTLNTGKLFILLYIKILIYYIGKVVQAWELAIPTMKVGEKAEIFCTSDYGKRKKLSVFISH
jgi:FKBP-type peptidyl-prolyl cis-trans isomerase